MISRDFGIYVRRDFYIRDEISVSDGPLSHARAHFRKYCGAYHSARIHAEIMKSAGKIRILETVVLIAGKGRERDSSLSFSEGLEIYRAFDHCIKLRPVPAGIASADSACLGGCT